MIRKLLAALFLALAPSIAFAAAPSVDGSCAAANQHTGAGCSLTTTLTNDLIVVAVYSETNNFPPTSVSAISGGGLSWTKRSSKTFSGGSGGDFEIWYASSAGTLTGAALSATFSSSVDDWAFMAFGVNGANATTPWDSNSSLPAFSTPTSGNKPSVSPVCTTGANDLLLAFMGATADNITNQNAVPSGFTKINSAGTNAGSLFAEVSTASEQIASPLSLATITWNVSNGTTTLIFDALAADGTVGGACSSASYMPFWTNMGL